MLFVVLLAAILVVLMVKSTRRYASKYLRHIALVVFFVGVGLYWRGFYDGNAVATGFRAILSSLEMFVSHSDLTEIELHQMETGHHVTTPLYMTVFALTHFVAVIVSAIVIAHLLGYRFVSWCRMLLDRTLRRKQELYVFFNANKASILLANDIVAGKERSGDAASYRIVFVVSTDDNHASRFTFSHFFSPGHGSGYLRKIEEMDAVIACIEGNPKEANGSNDYLGKLGLHNLRKMIGRAKVVKLFFLSDDENANVMGAISVKNNLAGKIGDGDYAIYCHARCDSVNTIVEESGLAGNIDIHMVDSSYLSVEQLKSNVDYQPVSFVDINDDATVGSAFTSLIVGFGETGEDALRFLYEFGAFPGEGGNRSKFKCYVVDRDCDRLQGEFYMQAPALAGSELIEMRQTDCKSEGFWMWLRTVVNELNYVVVAIGNDDAGINLAVDIYDFACRYRSNNLERFKIFVRSYDDANEQKLDDVARFINENNKQGGGEIVVFGKQRDLFTSKSIIDNDTIEEAKRYYESYRANYNRTAEYPDNCTWNDRHDIGKLLRKRKQEGREAIPQFLIQEIRRKESQDIANSRHAATKFRLAGSGIDELERCYKHRHGAKSGIEYRNADGSPNGKATTMMRNLAICEHLRWNASHELLGYTCNESDHTCCNEITKQHNCLVDWDALDTLPGDYKLYDYLVVETTIGGWQ